MGLNKYAIYITSHCKHMFSITDPKVDAYFIVLIVCRNVVEEIALSRIRVEVVCDARSSLETRYQTGTVAFNSRDRLVRRVESAQRELVPWIRHLHERSDTLEIVEGRGRWVETF